MITIWHNPRCSKSRQTLALLAPLDPAIRLYLQDPPSRDEILAVQAKLGCPLIQMLRPKDKQFGQAGLRADMPDAALLDAVVNAPILIERPIVITPTHAIIGRPPQAVLPLLG